MLLRAQGSRLVAAEASVAAPPTTRRSWDRANSLREWLSKVEVDAEWGDEHRLELAAPIVDADMVVRHKQRGSFVLIFVEDEVQRQQGHLPGL